MLPTSSIPYTLLSNFLQVPNPLCSIPSLAHRLTAVLSYFHNPIFGFIGMIALPDGSNQCLQNAHRRPPAFVKSAVTIIRKHHLYFFAIFLNTLAANIMINTKAQILTIVPLKAVVKILRAKLAISPATANRQKGLLSCHNCKDRNNYRHNKFDDI